MCRASSGRVPQSCRVRALVELDAEELADERGEPELLASEKLRRDHRVEDVREPHLEVAEEAREVVVGPVEHLRLRSFEDGRERLEVARRASVSTSQACEPTPICRKQTRSRYR